MCKKVLIIGAVVLILVAVAVIAVRILNSKK